jgi:hypothetical protein
MNKKIIKYAILTFSHIVCVVIGVWMTLYSYFEFVEKNQYENRACSDIKVGIQMLKSLKTSDDKEVEKLINLMIDGGLVKISRYKTIQEVKHKQMIIDSISNVKEYRDENNYIYSDKKTKGFIDKSYEFLNQSWEENN